MNRPFVQVDVFGGCPYRGNPVAVVLDGTGLDEESMGMFGRWTNLSETTFIVAPTHPNADYRVRIFSGDLELPFAGHPTLGTCHAWLTSSGNRPDQDIVVQECSAGLIEIRRNRSTLAFAAPPLIRYGPVEDDLVEHVAEVLQIERETIGAAHWVDNGPGWLAVLLDDATSVLNVQPGIVDLDIGVVGAYPASSATAFEVRAFSPKEGGTIEDPVTGSLNASLAKWFFDTGRATSGYVASQGTVLGRLGRVEIDRSDDGTIWVGGNTVTCIQGTVDL